MSWLCKLFGHIISGSEYSRYFTCSGGVVDGIGRQHISLFGECDRCKNKFHVGYIHGDSKGKITHDEKN